MGCLITMPLSSLVDWAWHGILPSVGDVIGAVLIALGFALLVRAERTSGNAQEEVGVVSPVMQAADAVDEGSSVYGQHGMTG